MSQRNPNDEASTANLPTPNVPTANAPTIQAPTPNVPRTKLPTTRVPTPNTPTTNSQHAGSLPADATPTGSKHIIDNGQDGPKRPKVSDNNIGPGAPQQYPQQHPQQQLLQQLLQQQQPLQQPLQKPLQQPPRNLSYPSSLPLGHGLGVGFPGGRAPYQPPNVIPPNPTTTSSQGSGSAGVVIPTYNPPTIETATVIFSFEIKRKIGTMGIDDGAFSRTIAHLEAEFPGADVRFSLEKS
ncbi:hypothetical protein RB213_012113 [Colletotrichum asianum]